MEILIAVACVEGVERDGGGGGRREKKGEGMGLRVSISFFLTISLVLEPKKRNDRCIKKLTSKKRTHVDNYQLQLL